MSLMSVLNEQATLKLNICEKLHWIENDIQKKLHTLSPEDPIAKQLLEILDEIKKKKEVEKQRSDERFKWYQELLEKAVNVKDGNIAKHVVAAIVKKD